MKAKRIKPAKFTLEVADDVIRRLLEPGDVVLEIGAADGGHSDRYAARVGPTGCVLAVEPHPDHLAPLQERQRTYPWIRILAAAVGSHNGAGILRCGGTLTSSSLYVRNIGGAVLEMYPVPMTTVDALVLTMPTAPNLIHVDAQGAEGAILRGAARTLLLPIPWIVEVWRDGLDGGGSSVEELLATFSAHGFAAHTVRGEPWPWSDLAAAAARSKYCDVVMLPRAA